jgi:Tol biopolymer transport system component
MSSERRFEQELPSLLEDLYMGPMPMYRDHILEQTARTRQRPAWSFLERWLPMVDVVRQPVFAPRLPWRTIGLGLAVLALLLAMVAALIGAQPNLPAPFGLARSGLIAFESGGDIYTADPVTGDSTAVVRGPETDIDPQWSRDGRWVVFERKATVDAITGLLFVARHDGSGLTQVTPEPLRNIASYAFAPDGTEILIGVGLPDAQRLWIAAADGSGIRQLDLATLVVRAAWRPPDGSEILIMDSVGGMYTIDAISDHIRPILASEPGRNRTDPKWSPDGSLISFVEWSEYANGLSSETHVMAADGTANHVLPIPPGAVWQAGWNWSNDGTRLLAIRGYTGTFEGSRAAVVPVDGSGPGIEIEYPGSIQAQCCSRWEWAPDDRSILGTPTDTSGAMLDQVLLDPVAGTFRTLPWTSVSQPSWQRLAP